MALFNNATIRVISIASLFLGGCTPTVFVHPTKNAADFERDKYECSLVATQFAANFGASGDPIMILGEMKRCLEFRYGWKPLKNDQASYAAGASGSGSKVAAPVYETNYEKGTIVRPFSFLEPDLYSDANQTSPKIRKLTKNTKLTVIRTSGDWIEVNTEESETGWVMKVFVRPDSKDGNNALDDSGTKNPDKR
jgi:hypothetical protein